jgi:hypothetical protein
MTGQSTLAEEFAQGCDRLKAFARRMALERGGFVPDTDALIDRLAEHVWQRHRQSGLSNLTSALNLDFMGETDWPED